MPKLRPILAAWCVIVLILTLPSCRGDTGRQPKTKVVTIGLLLPTSGGASVLGQAAQRGIELAVREFNSAQDSIQLRTVLQDDKADPTVGVSAFRQLTIDTTVCAIIGPLASGVASVVAPLANERQIVLLSPGASAPNLSDAGPYFFRNEMSEALGATRQAELAVDSLGFRRIGIYHVNNDYGVGTAHEFGERFRARGGEITRIEAFDPTTTNHRTTLLRLAQTNPDAIFVVFQDDIVNIIRQVRQQNISAQIFTTPVFENQVNLRTLGQAAEGVLYASYGTFDLSSRDENQQRFVTQYRSAFGEDPSYYSALGYDAARILILAFKRTGGECNRLSSELGQIRNFPGVTGTTSFDSNGDVAKPVVLKTVRGGEFVYH
jgi:branched-chain amino acid transport system substrate-binding protein